MNSSRRHSRSVLINTEDDSYKLGTGSPRENLSLANSRAAGRKFLLLFCLLLCAGCRESIVHDVSELDANRLITHLNGVAVDARKTKQPDGRWSVEVPERDAVTALRILEERRLLRAASTAPERAGITASREEHRFRLERSLSREIEHTLASIEGVLEARVHLNLPQTDPLFGTPLKDTPSSASVLLLGAKGSGVTRESIAALVSGASGIDVGKISVLISAPIDEQHSAYPPLPTPPPVEPWDAAELLPQVAGWLLVAVVALLVFMRRPKGKSREQLRQHWNPEAA